jgi:signal transduction histidine kinase
VAAGIPGRSNGGVGVVLLVALYSVAAYFPRRQAAWAGVVTGAVLAWPLWTTTDGVFGLSLSVLGWVWGAYVSELRGRAARSRREQELETGRAVAEEQARVGRELHDVIAHTLSVIVVQAGAAEDVFGTSPQAARQALGSIGSAGRQALAELRRVLAAVGPQPGEEDGWAPPPGLSGLGQLLDLVRAAGLEVTARVDGVPAVLPAGLDLAALPDRAGGPNQHAQARPCAGGRGDLVLRPGRPRRGGHRRRPARSAGRAARAGRGTGADRHPRARGAARRDL